MVWEEPCIRRNVGKDGQRNLPASFCTDSRVPQCMPAHGKDTDLGRVMKVCLHCSSPRTGPGFSHLCSTGPRFFPTTKQMSQIPPVETKGSVPETSSSADAEDTRAVCTAHLSIYAWVANKEVRKFLFMGYSPKTLQTVRKCFLPPSSPLNSGHAAGEGLGVQDTLAKVLAPINCSIWSKSAIASWTVSLALSLSRK